MKLAMKREALEKLKRRANEMTLGEVQTARRTWALPADGGFGTVLVQGSWKSKGTVFGIRTNALE